MNPLFRHAYDIGSGFAVLLLPFFGKRLRIATENILRAGIVTDEKAARQMARRSVRHLVGHICEALCVPFVVKADNWRAHFELDTPEFAPAAAELLVNRPDGPVLVASAHHGAWEAATNVLSFARPMLAIARVQNNRLAAAFMRRYHFRGPVRIVDKNHGFRPDVLRDWQERHAAFAILMDQFAGHGLPLRFFGRPARTYTTVARLAMRTGAPIVVGSFVRVGPYRYRPVAGEPVRLAKDADLAASVQLLNDRLEAAVRRYPEQYLWVHRRWRDD